MAETAPAPATVEINDAIFCTHFKEVCLDCPFDGREENDSFFGFDFTERDAIECPAATQNKEGVYQCKKHGSASCNQCYGWKKKITRAHAAQTKKTGQKAGRK